MTDEDKQEAGRAAAAEQAGQQGGQAPEGDELAEGTELREEDVTVADALNDRED